MAVMATPARVLATDPPVLATESVASEKLAEKRLAMVSPPGAVVSSRTAARVADPEAIGASFTAVMVSETVSEAVEKAVLPPVAVMLTLLPVDPEDWSQARKVMEGLMRPFQLAVGLK